MLHTPNFDYGPLPAGTPGKPLVTLPGENRPNNGSVPDILPRHGMSRCIFVNTLNLSARDNDFRTINFFIYKTSLL
jgi:hypothetical protein